ncbi:MAG TPA: phosphodiester glycosidase family protein, partial [Polyangiaceae bacterium]
MKRTWLHSLWLATLAFPSIAHADVTTPFTGVTLVDHGDRALAIADLCAAGVSMRVTKYAERQATPEQWATKSTVNAAVAINGDFFDFPGWTYVIGRAKGGGENWPAGDQNKENRSYWQFGSTFMPDLIVPASTAPNAAASDILGGHNVIIKDGKSLAPNFDGDAVILGTYRRTGVGLNASRSKVYLFASNTALSGADEAASMLAMAAEGGAPDLDVATNEDGGGSSQMYVRGKGQIVDSGRQVNDHLGIIANGSGP